MGYHSLGRDSVSLPSSPIDNFALNEYKYWSEDNIQASMPIFQGHDSSLFSHDTQPSTEEGPLQQDVDRPVVTDHLSIVSDNIWEHHQVNDNSLKNYDSNAEFFSNRSHRGSSVTDTSLDTSFFETALGSGAQIWGGNDTEHTLVTQTSGHLAGRLDEKPEIPFSYSDTFQPPFSFPDKQDAFVDEFEKITEDVWKYNQENPRDAEQHAEAEPIKVKSHEEQNGSSPFSSQSSVIDALPPTLDVLDMGFHGINKTPCGLEVWASKSPFDNSEYGSWVGFNRDTPKEIKLHLLPEPPKPNIGLKTSKTKGSTFSCLKKKSGIKLQSYRPLQPLKVLPKSPPKKAVSPFSPSEVRTTLSQCNIQSPILLSAKTIPLLPSKRTSPASVNKQ